MVKQKAKYSFRSLVILAASLTLGFLMIYYWNLLDNSAALFLKKHQQYVSYIVPLSIILGFVHAYRGHAEEHSLFLFKYLGPILASPLTCLTYAVIINSSFALIYIVCYDQGTILKYTSVDRTTLTYTLILLLSWSVFGLVKIIMDVVRIQSTEKTSEVMTRPQTISINEPNEINYWTQEFGVNTDVLNEAVQQAGTSIDAIREYLRNRAV
jgi:hypothetical protein